MSQRVPPELRTTPFTVSEARSHGLTWKMLQSNSWRRVSRGQYASRAIPDDTMLRLAAVKERLPAGFAFSGSTAAWILGRDVPACDPIEVTIGRDIAVRARAGVKVRRASLAVADVIVRRGYPVTSPLRTTCDRGSGRNLIEAVVAIDDFLHAGLVGLSELNRYVESNPGTKGIRRLRRAVSLADPLAESPMETRLRLELVLGRLPKPCLQVELHDRAGQFLGRVDLFYPDVGLIIEFDGQNHRERFAADLRRQNALVNAGYRLLRFTASDLLVRGAVAAQVRRARKLMSRHAP